MKNLFTTVIALFLLASFAFAGGGDKSCSTKTKSAGCCATKTAKTTKTAHSCDPLEGKCSNHPGSAKETSKAMPQDSKVDTKETNTTSPI
ncbi:MAG: hypothetical protein ACE5D8_09280 [Fidelibacterota bacterium]